MSERIGTSPAATATPCGGKAGSRKPGPSRSRAHCAPSLPRLPHTPAPTESSVGSRDLEGAPQPVPQLPLQSLRRDVAAIGKRPDHHVIGFIEAAQHGPGDVPQPTRNPVAFDGRTHRLRHDQTDPRALTIAVLRPPYMNDDVGLRVAHPGFHRRIKLGRPPHAVACGKHRPEPARTDQADRERRPLRRRPDTMARPARVRIRKRKPCTRARRRLFGWKVRLPLATAFSSLSVSCLWWSSGRSCFANALIRKRVGRVLLLAGAVPGAQHSGSQPHRRLSGDCLRVLTTPRPVKLGLPQRTH